ncbi:response regulator [Hydrotalea sp.]|uniref:response regulator n=1 Tax=Hydrotalea sp. TaxID=2881279 RepID=UPI003D09D394
MRKKILLIEDNLDMRENTAEILQLANYEVKTAENGKEGVALAEKEHFDLIICDIMMPVLDGYGVLHLLSKNKNTNSIPFIFLTAKAERTDFRKGMEMGADDYLTKPFDDIELLNAIESRLKKSELMRQEFANNVNGLNQFIETVKGFDSLKKISEENELRNYRKKEEIYKEDSYPKGLYLLVSGKIKTCKTNEDGKELITGLYSEGDYFGYIALLEDTKHKESAVVLEDAQVCMMPKTDFFELIYKNAEVSKKFIQMLSHQVQQREEQLLRLAYNSARKKVADALITLQNKYQQSSKQGNFSMQISREDLANIAGIATESTIRTLSDLKDEKLIEIQSGKITIINYEKLAALRN